MEQGVKRVKNNLGLVCITHSEEVRYKRTTRKRLLSLPEDERADLLRTLYAANATVLENAVAFCLANDVRLYRISSDVFQFTDEPFGRGILSEISDRLAAIGRKALDNGIRLVMHPDQFVVLSSDSDDVVANSIKILEMHGNTMDLLGHNGIRPLGFTFTRQFSEAGAGDRRIAYDWALWKLHHLYSLLLKGGATDEVRRQIDALRQQYGLKTLY